LDAPNWVIYFMVGTSFGVGWWAVDWTKKRFAPKESPAAHERTGPVVCCYLSGRGLLFARKGRKQREREAAQLEASRLLKELILALNSRR
jgi:hypothetical protein